MAHITVCVSLTWMTASRSVRRSTRCVAKATSTAVSLSGFSLGLPQAMHTLRASDADEAAAASVADETC